MKILAINKRAKFDYDLQDTFEGGLVLTGPEVKAAKAGSVQFTGAFLDIRGGQLWLKNAFISKYAPAAAAQKEYDPSRDRKVLVHKREISRLVGKKKAQGFTLVPVCLYLKGNLVKLEFAVGKGKKEFEKRASIKKREVDREIRQRMRE